MASWLTSWNGFVYAVRNERNVGIAFVFVVLAMITSAILQISLIEWIVVVLCCGFVVTTELLNTAIEAVTDLACNEEIHPLAKIAKDVAAGATGAASVTSVIIAALIFGPRVIEMLF